MFIPSLKLWNTSLFCLPLLSSFLRLVSTSRQSRFLSLGIDKMVLRIWTHSEAGRVSTRQSWPGHWRPAPIQRPPSTSDVNPEAAIDALRRSGGRHQRPTLIPKATIDAWSQSQLPSTPDTVVTVVVLSVAGCWPGVFLQKCRCCHHWTQVAGHCEHHASRHGHHSCVTDVVCSLQFSQVCPLSLSL